MDFSKAFRLNSLRRNNAGFTLIELAIVLVVIGLIIAAVLKGEDLINNGRMLNFVSNPVREAQTAAMAYYDRTGQYPDAVTDENDVTTGPLYNMYQAGISSVLDMNTYFNQGGVQLGAALGNIPVKGTDGTTAFYPVIVIKQVIKNPGGGFIDGGLITTPWTQSGLGYANYLKSKIDGNSSSWTSGRVRMLNSSVPVEFKELSSELSNGPSTAAYDGIINTGDHGPLTYSSSNFVAPAAGKSYTLVYFYDQQPH
jgi:prepilin-type N-terminal cleavage/methylation domain-containing protein